MSDERLDVLVLAGFLGAGKTTLVNRLLADPDAPPSAVLVNEFGSVALDGALIASSEEEVLELVNGCVCCSMRGDLVEAIEGLLSRRRGGLLRSARPFQRILIEMSGLASPGPVVQTLLAERGLAQAVRPAGVVTLANAEKIKEQLSEFAEVREQVGYADMLVLNQIDRVSADGALSAERALRTINASASIVRASHAALSPVLLAALGTELSSQPVLCPPGATQHDHGAGAGTLVLSSADPLSLHSVKIWLTFLANRRSHEIWRIKGILRCREVPSGVLVQGVYQHLSIGPSDQAPPDVSRIVLIGRDLDQSELERGWRAVGGTGSCSDD